MLGDAPVTNNIKSARNLVRSGSHKPLVNVTVPASNRTTILSNSTSRRHELPDEEKPVHEGGRKKRRRKKHGRKNRRKNRVRGERARGKKRKGKIIIILM